jgi:hypothetical protein
MVNTQATARPKKKKTASLPRSWKISLSTGCFSWPSQGDENGKVRLSQEQFSMLIGGIELKQTRRKDWYRKEIVEAGVEKPGD